MPTARGTRDLAPQSQRDSEHNYVVMFRNSPKSAASVYSRLFRSKDSTLLKFMDAFPWTRPTMKQQEQLWSSGFPIVLLEALTDNRWYESFKVNSGKFAGDDTSNSETREFGKTLRCLWCFMKNVDMKAPKHTAVLQECLQRFPAMWRLLWSYRDVMLLCPEGSEARGNLQRIAELLECYTAIHQTQHTGRAPPLESYAGHIALHFLIFPHDFRIYSIRHPACILWDIIETEGKDGFLREHSFLYEVFPAAVRFGGSEDHNIGGFYVIIILNLISNRPTRSSELRCTLNVLGLLLLWGPSILSSPATEFNPELYTIAMTAQQYGCLGWLDDDRKPGYESPDIARAFLTCYTGIVENVRNGADQELVGNIAEAPDWFGMVNIVAQSAVAVYEENDAAGKVIIERFLKCYNNIAMVGKSAYHTNRRRWHAYCYLRRMLQVYWLPTLNDLRTTMHGTPAQRTHRSAAVQASLHSLYKQWINLGQTFNLSQISREDDTGLTDYVTAKELRSGCYFSECLCYGKKPLKRPRRICKGCWSVYYCGPRCQERDWKAGHRDVCWGRHASANKPRAQ